jgi:hypothetical protein
MVRCKNAGGAPSDGDDSPPHLFEVARGKRIKIMARKKKKTLTDAKIAQAVAEAADAVERGGRSSGIHIGDSRFYLEGRQLGTETTETTEGTEVQMDADTMSVDPPASTFRGDSGTASSDSITSPLHTHTDSGDSQARGPASWRTSTSES